MNHPFLVLSDFAIEPFESSRPTISGIAKKLKESIPDIHIVGVDPIGSILGGGSDISSYKVEGIGYDFFPNVLDNSLVDKYIKTNDEDLF